MNHRHAVFLSHTGSLGGAERSLIELCTGLVRHHHWDVNVVLPGPSPLEDFFHRLGISTHRIEPTWWVSAAESLRGPRSRFDLLRARSRVMKREFRVLWRLLERLRPDLAVTNTLTVPTLAMAAHLKHIPHVWYGHEFVVRDHDMRFLLGSRLSAAVIGRYAGTLLACSEALANHLTRMTARPIPAVKYAMENPETPAPPPPNRALTSSTYRLVLVGAIHPGKRQLDAIRAIAELRHRGVPARLDLVGGGQREHVAMVQDGIRAAAVENATRLVGAVDDPTPFLDAADVAIVCSSSEAFGRVTVEAQKRDLPVIGAAAAGTLESIRPGQTGLLYPPCRPSALADAADFLWKYPLARLDMGRRAGRTARRRFTIDRFANDFVEAVASNT